MIRCPQCHSERIWKDGLRHNASELIQRFLCRDCGLRFSDRGNKIFASDHSMYVTHKGTSKLAATETVKATQRESNIKGQLISFAWHLKKMGRRESTIQTYSRYIQSLSQRCNIDEPDTVKLAIATHFEDQNSKRLVCYAYNAYTKFRGLKWDKPNYKAEHKQAFIPTEDELKQVVNTGKRLSVVFSTFIYETGARVNEAERLEWTDVDEQRNKVTLKASKNGKARTISVSKRLIGMLFSLPKDEKTVFPKRCKRARQIAFRKRVKTLARTLSNPRLAKVHYHTMRHCKALREYHKTRSMQHVKRVLGHRSILTTQRYVDLYEELYEDAPRDTVCEIALNVQEAKKLMEHGFRYETGEYSDGGKLFYKFK